MKTSKGFTTIELVVVMTVFLFVVGATMGIFISIVKSQKRILSSQELVNQISYVEEYMSKALRMAAVDKTGTDCFGDSRYAGYIYLLTRYDESGTHKGIKFINQTGDSTGKPICQEFFLDTDGFLKEIKGGGAPVELISSNRLELSSAKFAINGVSEPGFLNSCPDVATQCGASKEDAEQPRVTISLGVNVVGDPQNSGKVIQTTISQRNLNVK